MKKAITLSIIGFCFVLVFLSCKKSSDPAPAPDPAYVGFWKGKYGNGATAYPANGYAFLFRKDGTVRVFNNTDTTVAAKAEGIYSMLGTAVNTTYTYIVGGAQYSTVTSIDPNYTFQEGSWGSGTNTTNGGKFFIVKQ